MSNAVEAYAPYVNIAAKLLGYALDARAEGRKLALAAGADPAELDRMDAEADARFQLPLIDPLEE